nr:immunoglobulin light chain junction region [Macaca mulatta]
DYYCSSYATSSSLVF